MAIAFARVTQVQRSHGHSTVQRLAYLTRSRLVSQRTGETFDYSEARDAFYTRTLVPEGCVDFEGHAHRLWEVFEASSKLPNSVLGFELLLSLPRPSEFELQASCELAAQFVKQFIVDKHGLAATLAVHTPHGAANDLHRQDLLDQDGDADEFARGMAMASVNLHCHVLVSPRQLTPLGPSKKRYTQIDPVKRDGTVYGRNWGRLWHLFQNQTFITSGSTLRVTPNPPIALRPVPIGAVRRWRRAKRSAGPVVDGRALLINGERERENGELVASIDGALASLAAPFTLFELDTFYRRHVSDEQAAELVEATIGLGLCVELDVPDRNVEWFAGVHLVQHELAAFGRGLMLSERSSYQRDVSHSVSKEFSSTTRTVLEKLFAANDLVIVEAQSRADLLAQEIAGIANRAGIIPVAIATAAGHPAPKSVLVEIADLPHRMISQAIMIIDDPDSMTAAELSLALASGIAGNNKVVLLRRGNSDWPSLELLDLLSHHVQLLQWRPQHQRSHPNPPSLWRPDGLRTAIVHQPPGAFAAPSYPGWPRFCVDTIGEVSTSLLSVAATVHLLATFPSDIEWHYRGHLPDNDAAGLAKRLDSWLQAGAAPSPVVDAPPNVALDEYDSESAALEILAEGDQEEPEEYLEIDGPLPENDNLDDIAEDAVDYDWDDFEPDADDLDK